MSRGFISRDANHGPVWPFTINHDNSLARGLVGVWFAIGGRRYVNILGQNITPATSGASAVTGITPELGILNVDFAGDGSQGIILPRPRDLPAAHPLSLATWAAQDSGASNGVCIGFGDANTTGDNYFNLMYGGSDDGKPRFVGRDSEVQDVTHATDLRGTGHHLLVGTVNSALHSLYIDGVFSISRSSGDGIANPVALDTAIIGEGIRTAGRFEAINGQVPWAAAWNRVLSSEEVRRLFIAATRWNLYEGEEAETLAFVAAVAAGANPHGPLGHPLHGPFGGPV